MALIPLTQGLSAQVDDADVPLLSGYRWHAFKTGHSYYARSSYGLYMHRVIFGLGKGDRDEVDHINGDGLDNRRANLRRCSHAENLRNQRRQSSSRPKGVSYRPDKGSKCWHARIKIAGVTKHLGYFATPEQAAEAYNRAARAAFGVYAKTNS
jgi:hypothetical protein